MFKVNRLTSEQQSVENCFNLICWLKINHDQLQASYKMTLFYQNTLLKEDNRISPVRPLFWYPDFTFQNPFTKLAMFLKKALCSPQTKINYLESLVLLYGFVIIVYILGDILLSSKPLFFTMSPTVIYCAITQEYQQFMRKAKKAL